MQITSNLDHIIAETRKLHPQFRFAAAVALTRTAKDAERALYSEMGRVWNAPTPFSLRSLFTKPATKADLTASVEIKDQFPSKAMLSPDETYRHQYEGGRRRRKASELWFERAGLISSSESLAPSAGIRLDAYGNISRGMLMQIISQLRLGLDPYQWKSKSRRSTANRKRSGEFFWSRGGHLSRGVWMRRGRGVIQVLKPVPHHTYSVRMDMDRISTAVFDAKFLPRLDAEFASALASAR